MRVAAVGDNCVDVYYTLNRFYPTGNAVDFAINLKKLGQDVSLVSIQGDDVFGVSVENVLKKYGVDLTHFYKGGRQTAGGADIICFPELSYTGYFVKKDMLLEIAERRSVR